MPLYLSAKVQRICIDLDYLQRIFIGGCGHDDGCELTGVGIYCRRYASGAGRAGNYGAYVPQYLWCDFYRQIFDAVIVCDARDQFLFSFDCRSRSNIRQLSVQKAD